MRHFDHLSAHAISQLFHRAPQPFSSEDGPATLAIGLGATLYAPATRIALADDIAKQARRGLTSMVIDLEDAVSDDDVVEAERNAVEQLRRHRRKCSSGPMLFLRVREPSQIERVATALDADLDVLTGFVVPKFGGEIGKVYLRQVEEVSRRSGTWLYVMPVLESVAIMHRESRADELDSVARLLTAHRDRVLAVRIGATDLCSAYGLRRPPELSIYDVRVVSEVIGDIVNVFGRADGTGHVVTGPVWEYFSGVHRSPRSPLRAMASDRADPGPPQLQRDLALDGLVREVLLDQANGLSGKTVIHPSHVPVVHALSVVRFEEHQDALDILAEGSSSGGVLRSGFANKMNEVKPHRAWARKVLLRAKVFGVAAPGVTVAEVHAATVTAAADHTQPFSASVPA